MLTISSKGKDSSQCVLPEDVKRKMMEGLPQRKAVSYAGLREPVKNPMKSKRR